MSRPVSPAPDVAPVDDASLDRTFAAGDRIVGSYTVVRPLGRGGMGAVYLAVDDVSGQQVAVKVLPASLARERDIRERFVREARALAALDHPGIVPLVTFAQEGDERYLVMKYVGGRSLDAILGHALVLAPERARAIIREVASALAYAHDRGVVHRDIKPANILVEDAGADGAAGRVVIVDFGIARTLDGGRRVTETGMLMGTPQYMSPEQIVGASVDGRADLYACGLVLFEMLTGAPPFDGERTFDILRSHVDDPVPDVDERRRAFVPDAPPVPADLRRLLEALLEKDPDRRPAHARDVVAIIDGSLALAPSTPTPASDRPPARTRSASATPAVPFHDFDDDDIVRPRGHRVLAAATVVVAIAAASAGVLWQARPASDGVVVTDAGPDTRFEEAVLLARARVALDRGRLDDARIALETAIHLGATSSPALALTRAELQQRSGRPDEAARLLADVDAGALDPESRSRHAALTALLQAPMDVPSPGSLPPASTPPVPSPPPTASTTTPPPPRETVTSTSTRPSALDDDVLASITDSTRDVVAACYRDHIVSARVDVDDDDAPAGELRYRVDIAGDGAVAVARLTHATLEDPAFQACVASAVRQWRFPPFDGDGDTIFHTFTFRARR